jgi:hypothetical protein
MRCKRSARQASTPPWEGALEPPPPPLPLPPPPPPPPRDTDSVAQPSSEESSKERFEVDSTECKSVDMEFGACCFFFV